ncbi:hypothetical protein BJY59DRAFT_33694 [Rhodotorula toruloides]
MNVTAFSCFSSTGLVTVAGIKRVSLAQVRNITALQSPRTLGEVEHPPDRLLLLRHFCGEVAAHDVLHLLVIVSSLVRRLVTVVAQLEQLGIIHHLLHCLDEGRGRHVRLVEDRDCLLDAQPKRDLEALEEASRLRVVGGESVEAETPSTFACNDIDSVKTSLSTRETGRDVPVSRSHQTEAIILTSASVKFPAFCNAASPKPTRPSQ